MVSSAEGIHRRATLGPHATHDQPSLINISPPSLRFRAFFVTPRAPSHSVTELLQAVIDLEPFVVRGSIQQAVDTDGALDERPNDGDGHLPQTFTSYTPTHRTARSQQRRCQQQQILLFLLLQVGLADDRSIDEASQVRRRLCCIQGQQLVRVV